jgi:chorismate dehydratase
VRAGERAGEPSSAGRIRAGGIDYLNALPLTAYLECEGGPGIRLSNHPPSALAAMLRGGELDVALVPAVEYLARAEYRIVPGIAISSYGEVKSIRLYHRRPLREVRAVALDGSSRSSALLTRLLFRQLWGGAPEFRDLPPAAIEGALAAGEDPAAASLDAALLIGDAALERPAPAGWAMSDLGTEWTRWTGLPFVYAFWVWRGGPPPRDMVARFERAKAVGLARIDDLAAGARLPAGMDTAAARHYLHRVIQYDFDPPQVEGLLEFFRRAIAAGLVAGPVRRLEFLAREET